MSRSNKVLGLNLLTCCCLSVWTFHDLFSTPNTHTLSPNTCVLGYLVIQIVYRFNCVCVWLSVSLCLSCDRLAASPDPFSSPVRAPYSHEFGQAVKIIDEYCICVWSSESLLMSAFLPQGRNLQTIWQCSAAQPVIVITKLLVTAVGLAEYVCILTVVALLKLKCVTAWVILVFFASVSFILKKRLFLVLLCLSVFYLHFCVCVQVIKVKNLGTSGARVTKIQITAALTFIKSACQCDSSLMEIVFGHITTMLKIVSWNGHILVIQSFRWILGPNLDCAVKPCWDKCLKMSGNKLCCTSVNEYRSRFVPEAITPTCPGVKLKI